MNKKIQSLKNRLVKLNESLHKENLRIHGVVERFGWGRAMRCVKCTPSFTRHDQIKEKIREVEFKIKELSEG